jgi:hypothetical protein
MNKPVSILLFLLFALFASSCSSPGDERFNPVVIDDSNQLPDSLRQTFSTFSFPNGVLPILVVEDSVNDLLKLGAKADDLRDELGEKYEEQEFDKFGLLVYITNKPQLVQVRLGGYFDGYGNLCNVTTGIDYFTIQQLYTKGYTNTALHQMLTSVSKNMESRVNLNWWQKLQLGGIQITIYQVMSWFGSPSENFYGTAVAKPVYNCISFGSRFFGSWLWGIVLVFVIIILARWLLQQFLLIIIPNENVRKIVSGVILTVIGIVYSISAAGCSMLFSSGRLEDLYAIKAFNISNVDYFIANPSMFVQESNYLLAGLFVLFLGLTICVGYLTNDYVQLSMLSYEDQMKIWNSLSTKQQQFALGWNGATNPLKDGETPFEAIRLELSGKLGDSIGQVLPPMAFASLFFFPKAVLWTGIAFSITKIIFNIPKMKILWAKNTPQRQGSIVLIGSLMAMTLGFTIITIAIGWFVDPFGRKEKAPQEQVVTTLKQVVVTAKIANLRIGPGTNYDFATVNEDGTGGKWQVSRGAMLSVVAEENGWYRVRIDNNPREVYIKQTLCRDFVETNEEVHQQSLKDRAVSTQIEQEEYIEDDMYYDASDMGLLGSLPVGESRYSGDMNGYPIEFIISKNANNGDISAKYININYHTTMSMIGESLPAQGGDITFIGRENGRDWSINLTGDKDHIHGTAYGENKEFIIRLNRK